MAQRERYSGKAKGIGISSTFLIQIVSKLSANSIN